MSQFVLLDNEAVQALGHPSHPKHRQVVAYAQVVTHRKRRAVEIQILAPTAVRVEAGWDRTDPAWAFINRLRIADVALDGAHADIAAAVRSRMGVSVADAHIGSVIQVFAVDRITIVTSDPEDMRLVAGTRRVEIVAI